MNLHIYFRTLSVANRHLLKFSINTAHRTLIELHGPARIHITRHVLVIFVPLDEQMALSQAAYFSVNQISSINDIVPVTGRIVTTLDETGKGTMYYYIIA